MSKAKAKAKAEAKAAAEAEAKAEAKAAARDAKATVPKVTAPSKTKFGRSKILTNPLSNQEFARGHLMDCVAPPF